VITFCHSDKNCAGRWGIQQKFRINTLPYEHENMESLYVLGARQRKLLLKEEEEWNLYESALIFRLDPTAGEVRTCVEYETPREPRANEHSLKRVQERSADGKHPIYLHFD